MEEALERCALVKGAGNRKDQACVMTALSWVAGQAWNDHLPCAHPLLNTWAIQGNDATGTTPEGRADILRAGATGILNTWWVPTEVVLSAWSQAPQDTGAVARMVSVCAAVSEWKEAEAKPRAYLARADLE